MRKMSFFLHTLLIFLTLIFLSNAFAQGALSQPSVRLVYFLPNDRPARQERVAALQELIKDAQEFYADEMERHGFGRKTFRVETDRSGEPIVHRFKGRFNERHYYQRLTDFKVWEEFYEKVNDPEHVYLIAIDLSYELLNEGESCGLGGVTFSPLHADTDWFFGSAAIRHRDETPGEEVLGGSAIMPASGHCFYDNRGFLHPLRLITHELAHAFGLDHDFSDPDSAVGGRGFRFSQCDTEWLSVSRFFNSNPASENTPGNIQPISPPTYSPKGITLRFEVTDADGLHQAQLLVPEDGSWGPWELIGCKALDGQTQQVEFLSSELTSAPEKVMLQFMDDLGNITWATFLVDIAAVLPTPKVVSIPDRNLAAAVRKALGLGATATITDQAMKALTRLDARESQIKNLTGLEHATRLVELALFHNQIQDVSSLERLTELQRLYLQDNKITDITPLAKLTQLRQLHLWGNQIRDISVLGGLTKLESLWLESNQIRDISPLTGLTQLTDLKLNGNPIQDTSVLASLTKLRDVDIDIHQKSVPATGTWLAVEQPSGLSAANLVIKPGTFAIFVHKNQPSISQPADFNTYRLRSVLGAADFPNLADFFQNGGRIELVSHPSVNPLPPHTREPEFGDVVISEIMWGLNGSNQRKQYIELYNTSVHTYTFAHGDLMFRFSKASEEPLSEGIFTPPFNPNAQLKVIDKVSNTDWKVPGQSGNISRDQPLISMYRTIDYTTGSVPDGALANSWRASTGRVNLLSPSYGTPGAKHLPPAPVVHVGLSERPPMYWVNTDDGTLHRLIGDEVENLVPTVKNATSLAIDMTGGKLYWTEKTSDRTGRVRRANLDGTNVKLVKNLTRVPYSIAHDVAGRKIYYTNSNGKIQRVNINGSNLKGNLIRGLDAPEHIALDVGGGKVYWTEAGESIRRANLNGSNVEMLVSDLGTVGDIVIAEGKLYWTEQTGKNSGKIQRSDLDGNNVRTLATLRSVPLGLGVDTTGKKLYWTNAGGKIQRANLNGKRVQTVVTDLGTPMGLVLGTGSAEAMVAAAPNMVFPDETALLSNYPNPFNPETWIPYQLAKPADVTITIYAVNGQLIRRLVLGHQLAGTYQSRSRAAYWDGRNQWGEPVASGVYFYTFTASKFTATRKMVILK